MGRKPIGHTILRLEETHSTNTLVMETEEYLENHGLVVLARHQTAGRGRMGRSFASVPGAQLLFTVSIHPRAAPQDLAASSLVAGLAVAEGIETALGAEPRLKWPNDVTLNGRKVCGILTELKQGPRGAVRLVVGIGINCQGTAEDFPPELHGVLTTLAAETGRDFDNETVLQAVLGHLEADYRRLDAGERPALLDGWRKRAHLAGRRVRFSVGKESRDGTAEDISGEGHLLIRTPDGALHTQASGSVEWLD
ncbi:MAG: biotin--[acetyl-CoA-carboxylase] ligase [SAR324 cluster bacterium]|nr:biotin--[acetyl-CoA-carboxylase] ligase [SAR324 cluster bacterium]